MEYENSKGVCSPHDYLRTHVHKKRQKGVFFSEIWRRQCFFKGVFFHFLSIFSATTYKQC